VPGAAKMGLLEETLIIPSTVKNSMDEDCLAFDGVEDKVVLNNEVAIMAGKILFLGNSSQAGILSQE